MRKHDVPSLIRPQTAAFESLEERRMLAAQPLASAALDASGSLVITGTNRRDVITVALNAADATKLDVTLNGTTSTFNVAEILAGIRASGGNGHDDIRVDAAVSLRAELYGGNGHDALTGGSAGDLLDGGNGKDVLAGGGGDDDCLGGNGKDRLSGGDGDDDLHGGKGSDDLDGDAGEDDLFGEKGRDRCNGGADSDAFDDEDEAEDMEEIDDLLIRYADLPAAVRAAFEAAFAGATVHEVEAEQEDAGLEYELEFTTAAGVSGEAEYDAAGNLLDLD